MKTIVYDNLNVYDATVLRIQYLFDNYDNISISVSGGKDSTVLFHLLLDEAIKRNRKFIAYFLDQEAEYLETIKWIDWAMSQPNVIPEWYQVPFVLNNAISQEQIYLFAWGKDEQHIRAKSPLSIHSIDGDYPQGFYAFCYWREKKLEKLNGNTISLLGLRAQESPDRRHAVYSGEVEDGLFWLRKNIRGTLIDIAYPLADWKDIDIWKYLTHFNKKYNKVYDMMYKMGLDINKMRVSNLIHEKAFRSLSQLQQIEPETFNKLCLRLKGVHTAGLYADENMVYSVNTLPSKFNSWREYRRNLFDNMHPDLNKLFKKQFNKYLKKHTIDELEERYMVKRILLLDWEGVFKFNDEDTLENQTKKIINKWKDI